MINSGSTPQEARSVLTNSLKTEIIVTMNLYNWDHFFDLRCAPDAHPDIQVVAKMALKKFVDEVYTHV
jgi:thymidylate synthase (FAD)